MSQSNYGPSHSVKAYSGTPVKSYTSVHCGNRGHYTKNCLTNKDKKCEDPKQIQRSTGIPRSFVAEVLDRSPKGTMLTNTGQYAIPVTVA
ncbi:E3 ubiquitin-protein ligase RBBP6-like [Scleropages formosus]|uniref:E3 ubiquitin-protein ligase RBBP6-like n=1 Tax=Scleropages formosus TaxID=113540 RepID=UPI0008791F18|nr:E3 ubiquitin-protein ligase RBBP6-like [Scleropages formosus]